MGLAMRHPPPERARPQPPYAPSFSCRAACCKQHGKSQASRGRGRGIQRIGDSLELLGGCWVASGGGCWVSAGVSRGETGNETHAHYSLKRPAVASVGQRWAALASQLPGVGQGLPEAGQASAASRGCQACANHPTAHRQPLQRRRHGLGCLQGRRASPQPFTTRTMTTAEMLQAVSNIREDAEARLLEIQAEIQALEEEAQQLEEVLR